MGKFTLKDTLRMVAWVFIGLFIAITIAETAVLYQKTIIKWWLPVSVAFALALIISFVCHRYWEWLTRSSYTPINFCCNAIMTFTILLFAFYGINYFFADKDTEHTETVTIEKRYREERHKTRRIGRRVYADGPVYYEYYITVRFDDGRQKDLNIPLNRYNKFRTGSKRQIRVSTGYLGIPIINDPSL